MDDLAQSLFKRSFSKSIWRVLLTPLTLVWSAWKGGTCMCLWYSAKGSNLTMNWVKSSQLGLKLTEFPCILQPYPTWVLYFQHSPLKWSKRVSPSFFTCRRLGEIQFTASPVSVILELCLVQWNGLTAGSWQTEVLLHSTHCELVESAATGCVVDLEFTGL